MLGTTHTNGILASSAGNNDHLRPSTIGGAAAVASVVMSLSSPRSAIFMPRSSESKNDVQNLADEKERETDDEDDFEDLKKRKDIEA